MFVVVFWMLIFQSGHAFEYLSHFFLATFATLIAAQFDWLSLAQRGLLRKARKSTQHKKQCSLEWTLDGKAVPHVDVDPQTVDNEMSLARGKMNSYGLVGYIGIGSVLLLVLLVAVARGVYIPSPFLVAAMAFVADMALTILVFGTSWFELWSCASISKSGIAVSSNIFSRVHNYPAREVIVEAKTLGFSLIRLAIVTGERRYVIVSDNEVLDKLRQIRDSGGEVC